MFGFKGRVLVFMGGGEVEANWCWRLVNKRVCFYEILFDVLLIVFLRNRNDGKV